jgi:hypothetical protein
MHKRRLFIALAFTAIPLFTGCPIILGGGMAGYDVHYTYNQNASSRDVFIQYYLEVDPFYQYPADVYDTYGNVLAKNSRAEGLYGVVGPGADAVIAKILIIDTDSHTLLKKIDRDTFYAMLTKETRVEKKGYEKITYYNYYFTITDAFLNEHE